jgi:hypothetical protein
MNDKLEGVAEAVVMVYFGILTAKHFKYKN